jgi:TolB-like protein/Flp pilus assembly protein TadD
MGAESPKTASTPTGAVFLSYPSQDAEAARRICEALRAAGIEVWLDQSELRGGDAWDRKIRDQIRHCTLFIPIISAHSQARLEGYFRREWKFAVERKRDIADELAFLLPVVIDETPERGASVPEGFHEVQWTRLPGGAASQEFIQHVSRLLTGHPDRPKPAVQAFQPSPAPTPARPASGSKPGSPLPLWLLLIAAAIAVIVGYIGIDRYVLHKSTQLSAASATAANADKSIAVLPFADLSEKHDQEYFADGMAEEIIDLLVRIPNLTVIGRTSSFQFKGRNEDLRAIGAKLNAAHILEGSVRKSGEQVRITAQLVDARTGAHEWSETYDRQIGDVLKLQDAIAAGVVRELQLTVAPGYLNERAIVRSADAYDLMLRGRHAADRWDRDGLNEAVALLKQALERDPTSADAAAELAFTYYKQAADNFVLPVTAFEQARLAVNTALKLDPGSARAHYVLGKIHIVYDLDWAAAEQELDEVATIAPGSADAPAGKARLAFTLGRWEEGLTQVRAALALDPLDANTVNALSLLQWGRGNLAEAEAAALRVLDIRPTYTWGHYYLARILLARGDRDAALREALQEPADTNGVQQSGLAIVYSALGRKADSDTALAGLIKEHADRCAFVIAVAYATRGQSDEAVDWLERAYVQKDPGLVYLRVELPQQGRSLGPRFTAFLHKMNLPE